LYRKSKPAALLVLCLAKASNAHLQSSPAAFFFSRKRP